MSLTMTAIDSDEPAADDAALLEAAQAGDRTAFGHLYDRHVRAVY